jgi:DNA-binding XRE family transcriptional regulator
MVRCMTAAAAEGSDGPVIPAWTFADRMRKIRRDVLDLEQGPFAEKLGVTKQAYAAWETGRTHPRDILALARRVELVSGVPAEWVLGFRATDASTGRYDAAPSGVVEGLAQVTELRPRYRAVSPCNGSSDPDSDNAPPSSGDIPAGLVNRANAA